MNTSEILKLYETSAKGHIEPHAKILEITYSNINLANEYHPLHDWQLQMLDDIVNLACFNQNMCVYLNTSFVMDSFDVSISGKDFSSISISVIRTSFLIGTNPMVISFLLGLK